MILPATFPQTNCLAEISTEDPVINDVMLDTRQSISGLQALFLSPSDVIDGASGELQPGILKDRHHRSIELPHDDILLCDKMGNLYKILRLKGMGLYSGPFDHHKGQIRNIRKDATGEILGLQVAHEINNAMENSRKLQDMGVETEMPLAYFVLKQVILTNREKLVERVNFADAIRRRKLPAEYGRTPFAVRLDAMGINARLSDFIHADNMFIGSGFSADDTRDIFMQEALSFLQLEQRNGRLDYKGDIDIENPEDMLKLIVKRIYKNLALVHKEGGVHGRMTPDNITMDGRFVDYDTLKWYTANDPEREQGQKDDCKRLHEATLEFLKYVLIFVGEYDLNDTNLQKAIENIMKEAVIYEQITS